MEENKVVKNILKTFRKSQKQHDWTKDENYEPRVKVIKTYTKVREDGSKVVRVKTKMSKPDAPIAVLRCMNAGPFDVVKHPNYGHISYKERPHINMGPRYSNRTTANRTYRIQIRPLLRRVLNKRAIALIKEGLKKSLFDLRGMILPEYKKTMLITVPNKVHYKHPGYQQGYKYTHIPEGFKEIGRKIIVINDN